MNETSERMREGRDLCRFTSVEWATLRPKGGSLHLITRPTPEDKKLASLYDMVKDIAACTTQSRKALDDLMHGIAALETLTEVVLPSEQENDAAATALTHAYTAFSRVYRAEFHAARAADTAMRYQEAQALREAIDSDPPPSFDEDQQP